MKTIQDFVGEYNKIGGQIAGDDFAEVDSAIDAMVEFSKQLKTTPREFQREFLIELHGEMFGSNPGDTDESRLSEIVSCLWDYYPRWDGRGAEDFSDLAEN